MMTEYHKKCFLYLGGDRADLTTIMAKTRALQYILDNWLRQVSLA